METWQWRQDNDNAAMRDSLIVLVPMALTVVLIFLWFFWNPLVNLFDLAY